MGSQVASISLVVVHDDTLCATIQCDGARGQEGHSDGHLVATPLGRHATVQSLHLHFIAASREERVLAVAVQRVFRHRVIVELLQSQ